jgi:hypothetical protein
MKIDVDTADRRVEAAVYGLFATRYAGYAEGRGCTIVAKDEIPDRAAAPPLPPPTAPDVLWPTGETAQLSDSRRLRAALNDPVLQGPGMRAIVVVHDGRIVGENYGEGFTASTPLLGWSMTKTVNAALVGMAIKDGRLSLDQNGLFPQWAGDARAEIAVADLMAMASGLEFNEDRLRRVPLEGELRRVVQNEDQALRPTGAVARRLKVPRENVRFVYPIVGQEAVRCLGVRPVLAGKGQALSHRPPDLTQQLMKPLGQAFVGKLAASKLTIKPRSMTIVHRTAPESVPDKESHAIRAAQTPSASASCG